MVLPDLRTLINTVQNRCVERMSCAVPHRGPDGQGVYFVQAPDANVGLGHRRLSIIDLSTAASQPMHYNGMHLIFNGEIYNYNEIRNQLIAEGHTFSTHSDTEVILHSWDAWKEKSIDRWRGMFSIVLYDERTQEMICIRDRAGVKPFHYYWKDGLFLFGSELKSLTAHEGFRKRSIQMPLLLFYNTGAFLIRIPFITTLSNFRPATFCGST